jgi:hypothetical protein
MAHNFLAIPATCVSVEWLFSRSWHLCHEMHSSMKAETIPQSMLMERWVKAGYLKY